jgi:hypothetical protein
MTLVESVDGVVRTGLEMGDESELAGAVTTASDDAERSPSAENAERRADLKPPSATTMTPVERRTAPPTSSSAIARGDPSAPIETIGSDPILHCAAGVLPI